MTGFGKQEIELPGKKLTIEIRSLNSKQLDINARLPTLYKEKELELRGLIGKKLERGKIDLSIYLEYTGEETNYTINVEAVRDYYRNLVSLDSGFEKNTTNDFLSIIMKMPEVVKPEREELDESEWEAVIESVNKAIDEVRKFRQKEGESLIGDFRNRIDMIVSMLQKIEPFEEERVQNIKNKLTIQLNELEDIRYDTNRLEQELIYYLEKLDVTEEKVRLQKHCDHFNEVLEKESAQGKKLGFIAQEIGREINTLGSKANHAEIQRTIVGMKDELEKIKEQLMNIL
jgi:uncharacterized protein (TIGR00255 family)